MAAQKKQHWYLLAFAVPGAGFTGFTSLFMSNSSNRLNLPALQAARQQKGIPDNACMISTSYLGCMTQDEMNPPPETIPNLIAPTEPYMDGYHAAVLMQTAGNSAPHNPFVSQVAGEALPQEGIDWAEGFMAGCKRYGAVGQTNV